MKVNSELLNNPEWDKGFKQHNTVIGWDIETDNNHNLTLICNSKREYLFYPNFEELLNLILKYSTKNYTNFFYNLKFDSGQIIKLIFKDNPQEYQQFRKLDYATINNIEIYYTPDKILKITDTTIKKTVVFYDIAQFYKTGNKYISLNNASIKYLNKNKIDITSNIDITDIRKVYLDNTEYKTTLLKYCIQDCVLCAELSVYFINQYRNAVGIHTHKLISPAYLSQEYFRKQLTQRNILKESVLSKKHNKKFMKIFSKVYYGGRLEVIKKGFIGNCHYYDIKSAYPFALSDLKGLSGEVTYNHNKKLDNHYNVYKVLIQPYRYHINPLPFRRKDSTIYYPDVPKPIYKWVNDYDIELMDLYGVNYEIVNSIHFEQTDNFLFNIEELFKQKENSEFKEIFKIIINSIYGKTLQIVKQKIKVEKETRTSFRIPIDKDTFAHYEKSYKTGLFFNSLFASLITSGTRLMILKNSFDNMKDIIYFSTDCIISKHKLNVKIGSNLGEFEHRELFDFVLYGSGRYKGYYYDKENKKIEINREQSVISNKRFKGYKQSQEAENIHTIIEPNTVISYQDNKRNFGDIIFTKELLENNIYESVPIILNEDEPYKKMYEMVN